MLSNPFRSRRARQARASRLQLVLAGGVLLVAACSGSASPSSSAASSAGGSSATASSGPVQDVLAGSMPTKVGDVEMTVKSGTLTDLKDDLPNYDQLVERLGNAFVQPSDVIAAVSAPTNGATDPRVAGLVVTQLPPGGLGLLGLMQAWVADVPGATSTNTNVGGKPVVHVTFADASQLPLYYYLFDTEKSDQESADTMYFVRSADETLAADALSQLP